MKYIKLYENKNKWNKILRDATWTQNKIGEDLWYMDLDKIKLAIENGADPNSCATLNWASRMNNLEVAKYMLEHGANADDMKKPFADSCEWTPLMSAANDGYVEMAKLLIDYEADPFHPNFQGYTTIDVVTPKRETSNASFGYESQTKEMKRKRDEIRKYLENNSIHLVSKKYNV